ncbi:hypothetical protein BJF90_42180 [Pseudonocardia sp. CNS-004]|nr:hypothetical protein BJF90_42180 [Pseudonocardia sp. CNS-004]
MPVVGTAVGGVPEMIEDGVTGHLVPPQHPRAMADALVKVLRDPARDAMGRAARDRVLAEFTLDRSVARAGEALARTAGREPARLAIVLDQTAVGGAERLLLDLCRQFDRTLVEPRLVCLRAEGPLGDAFREVVPVEVLERTGRFDMRTLPRLVRSLRAARIDVVLVAHHNRAALALGRVAARVAGAANVVAAHDMDLTRVGGRVLPRHVVETLFLSEALVLLAPSQGRYLHDEEGVGRFPWRRARGGDPERDRRRAAARRGRAGRGPPQARAGRRGPRDRHRRPVEQAEGAPRAAAGRGSVARGPAAAAPRRDRRWCGGTRPAGLGRRAGDRRARGVHRRARRRQGAPAGLRRHLPVVRARSAPLVVLESMAAGVPVVATDCGAVRDLVADGREGCVVPVGDPAALAARLGTLLDDPRMRADMGERARRRAEAEYSIERTTARFQELVTGLASR